MADHDQVAELEAYRRELAALEASGKGDRADQVRPLLADVERAVRAAGAALRRASVAAREAGQDAVADQLSVKAERFEVAAGPEPVVEQAVPAKARRRGSESEG